MERRRQRKREGEMEGERKRKKREWERVACTHKYGRTSRKCWRAKVGVPRLFLTTLGRAMDKLIAFTLPGRALTFPRSVSQSVSMRDYYIKNKLSLSYLSAQLIL